MRCEIALNRNMYVPISPYLGGTGDNSPEAPPSPQRRPGGGPANSGDFPRPRGYSTQMTTDPRGTKLRPIVPSKWRFLRISGDRARICMKIHPSPQTGRAADPRPAGIFHHFLQILHNRPLIRDVRNCATSRKVSGDFAESRPVGRDIPRS